MHGEDGNACEELQLWNCLPFHFITTPRLDIDVHTHSKKALTVALNDDELNISYLPTFSCVFTASRLITLKLNHELFCIEFPLHMERNITSAFQPSFLQFVICQGLGLRSSLLFQGVTMVQSKYWFRQFQLT